MKRICSLYMEKKGKKEKNFTSAILKIVANEDSFFLKINGAEEGDIGRETNF